MQSTRDQLLANGFNGVGACSDVDLLRASPAQSAHPLAYTVNLDLMSAYGNKRGGTYEVPGHKGYPKTPSSLLIRGLRDSPINTSPRRWPPTATIPISSATSRKTAAR
jgi:hypothetical protein